MTIWSHEDPVPGTFNDGAFPVDRPVLVRQKMGELVILDQDSREELARWPLGTLRPVPERDFPHTLRLRQSEGEGARLAIFDRAFNEGLADWWPALGRRMVVDKATLRTACRVSLAAIAGLGLFFLVLLPFLGQLGARLVPPALERDAAEVFLRHGDPLLQRINSARVCNTGPIAPVMEKLVGPLRKASGWPGDIHIRVIDDPLPNAAAVPGGEIVLFRGMLQFARNADELAGILAHEIGHVSQRHAVRNLFVTSLNFFGFDQLLGNFSGQLVVHPVSGLVLTRREGRRAEQEADRSAVEMLKKAGVNVRPLADILDRIGYLQGEKEIGEGWLSTHPLSRRRARMIRDAAPEKPGPPVLTAAEFSQLRAICETQMPEKTVPPGGEDSGLSGNDASGSAGRESAAEDAAPSTEASDPETGAGEETPENSPEKEEKPSVSPGLADWDTGE